MKHLTKISSEFVKKVGATYPKWWDRLTYDEQKEYIHDHPGTDLRATAPRSTLTGQEPITATHYSVKGRMTNELGNPIGGVVHETINVSDNRFSGAKTLQDLVDKIQQSQPKFKVVNIKPKQKVKSLSPVPSSTYLNVLSQEMYGQNFDSVNMTPVQKRRVERQLENERLNVTVEKGKVKKNPVISDKPLVVGNMAQKILFLCEMQGQISDGQWENARGGDHWKVWSDLDWDKVGIGDNIGRKFYARRDAYNFTNSELLDNIGDRMLYKVNIYKKYPKQSEELLATDHWTIPDSYHEAKDVYEGRHIKANDPNDYWAKKRQKLIDAGLTLEMFKDTEENPVYTKSDMIKDLKGLKKAFKPESDNLELYKLTYDIMQNGSLVFRSYTVKAFNDQDAIRRAKENIHDQMHNIRVFKVKVDE